MSTPKESQEEDSTMKRRHGMPPCAIILAAVLVLAIGSVAVLWHLGSESLPHDVVYKNLSISEAQQLVIFPICAPSYIPHGMEANPHFTYWADDIQIPQTTYIRLLYKHIGSRDRAFEVYERYMTRSAEGLDEQNIS